MLRSRPYLAAPCPYCRLLGPWNLGRPGRTEPHAGPPRTTGLPGIGALTAGRIRDRARREREGKRV